MVGCSFKFVGSGDNQSVEKSIEYLAIWTWCYMGTQLHGCSYGIGVLQAVFLSPLTACWSCLSNTLGQHIITAEFHDTSSHWQAAFLLLIANVGTS